MQLHRDVEGPGRGDAVQVSKHLWILREAGLLKAQKSGRRHLYTVPETITRLAGGDGVLDLGCCVFRFDRTPRT